MRLIPKLTTCARIVAVAAIMAPWGAIAQDMVVTASNAASVGPGLMLGADAPLTLAAGEEITLLGPAGPVDVAGPFSGTASEAAGLTQIAAASPLSDLVKRRGRMKKLGAFRSSATGEPEQNETMFDLFADSSWCATPGQKPTLYVAARQSNRVITLKASNGNIIEILWPRGESIQPWPDSASLNAGEIYQAGVSGVDLGTVTIKSGPTSSDPTTRIDGLIKAGCMAQAESAIADLSN